MWRVPAKHSRQLQLLLRIQVHWLGKRGGMRRVIRRHIRRRADGVDLAVDVNAVFAINRGTGPTEAVQSTSIVQDATARADDEGDGPVARPERRLSPGGAMTKEPDQFKPLTREELSELAGEELPERAAMSLVNANVAIPINAAVAANVLSDGAAAVAAAQQQTPIDQSNL